MQMQHLMPTNGNVTFTGAGRLECSNTVTSLGNLSTGVGTVEYDGAGQNVLKILIIILK